MSQTRRLAVHWNHPTQGHRFKDHHTVKPWQYRERAFRAAAAQAARGTVYPITHRSPKQVARDERCALRRARWDAFVAGVAEDARSLDDA